MDKNEPELLLIHIRPKHHAKDNTLIDDENFFNVEELHIINERVNMSDNYFTIADDNKIMDLFLYL